MRKNYDGKVWLSSPPLELSGIHEVKPPYHFLSRFSCPIVKSWLLHFVSPWFETLINMKFVLLKANVFTNIVLVSMSINVIFHFVRKTLLKNLDDKPNHWKFIAIFMLTIWNMFMWWKLCHHCSRKRKSLVNFQWSTKFYSLLQIVLSYKVNVVVHTSLNVWFIDQDLFVV